MRYLIASLIPTPIADTLRTTYDTAFLRPCPIRMLHTTFIPPFSTNAVSSISSLLTNLPPFSSHCLFGPHGVFSPQVLYLPILPPDELNHTYQLLMSKLKNDIVTETNFEYLPHLTLDYHFDSQLSRLTIPDNSFTLPKPQLFIETSPKVWEPYST